MSKSKHFFQNIGRYRPGPGVLVTAAFIGPGTIATCSIAGAKFGFSLLWGLVFSVLATIVLQEMAARLGIITRFGLGEALRVHFSKALPRVLAAVLVISAIAIGNAAFEAGNITGASLGLESFGSGGLSFRWLWVLLIGGITFLVLFSGSYHLIESVLISLVILMSLTFLSTAIFIGPDLMAVLKGMFIPGLPNGSVLTVVGLIGTTVVPYNLFLYATAVQKRFRDPAALPAARRDISFSVILGGVISMAIVITSAAAFFQSGHLPLGGNDLALQLKPLLGEWSSLFIGAGLFAAGISSAITAPLAAAWATCGILGWQIHMRSWRFRMIWMLILFTGLSFALAGFRPLEVILFAQAANGILLPVIVGYLLWVMNNKEIMGSHVNRWLSNLAGFTVFLVVTGLGLRSILLILGK